MKRTLTAIAAAAIAFGTLTACGQTDAKVEHHP